MIASQDNAAWFHRHPRLVLAAFALGGSMLVLLGAELATRLLLPQWAPVAPESFRFWKYDELLGWTHTPGHRGRFEHEDFSVAVTINSHGLRDTEYPLERTAKKRMLVLGDSFGWGFGVEEQDRFSELLEQRHPEWEIINASVTAYGTDQEFLFLKNRGLAFKPDAVLLLFYENDFANNTSPMQHWYFKPYFVIDDGALGLRNVPVPRISTRHRLEKALVGHTYVGPRIYYPLLNLSKRLMGGERAPADETGGKGDEVTYRLVDEIDGLCRQNGATFVLVSTPMNEEKRTFLYRLAENEKIPYLALDPHFDRALTSLRFPHDVHWNAKGHAVAAGAIDGFLVDLGLFDAAGAGPAVAGPP